MLDTRFSSSHMYITLPKPRVRQTPTLQIQCLHFAVPSSLRRRVEGRHHTGRVPPTLRAARLAQIGVDPDSAEALHKGEELCAACYDKRSAKQEFIPLPVSLKA